MVRWPSRARPPVSSGVIHQEVAHGDVADTLPELDRVALAELERMGAYLRTLKAFQLKADVVTALGG